VAQMGLTPRSPLRALEECVTGVRRLLAGETVDEAGSHFRFDAITLTHPPRVQVPILTGVLGPRSLQLSGRIADGTVVSVLAGAAYLDRLGEHVAAERSAAAGDRYLLPTFALFNIDHDGAAARAAVRPMLGFYLAALGSENPLTEPYGYNAALADMLERGGADLVAKEMPDTWIEHLAVAGDPEEVGLRIETLRAAGATSVVLSPVDSDHADAQLKLFADTVLKNL
jgi:5,10-methylenetetrahydromethanopterin reductase